MKIICFILLLAANLSYAQELRTITAEDYISANPSTERKEIVDYITKQFEGESVSQAQLDTLWNDVETREALHLARFQIINQKLYASGVDETHPHFRSLIRYFKRLLLKYRVNDVDFMVHTLDELKKTDDTDFFVNKSLNIPSFLMSKDLDCPYESKKLLLPDAFMLWNTYADLLERIEQANIKEAWSKKIEKIYWRGSATGNASLPYTLENFAKLPRLSLIMLSKLYPKQIDAKFIYYGDEAFEKDKGSVLKSTLDLLDASIGKVTEEDHLKYKYLISIDGNTCAWVRVPWIMYSNSVLIKQETNKIEWFYPALKPYVHYVPVNERLTDVFQQYEWMKTHDPELITISHNAHNFIKNNLMPEDIEVQMVLILNNYSKIQQDNKLLATVVPVQETLSYKGIALAIITRIKRTFISWVREL
jgi:hypothetical protein